MKQTNKQTNQTNQTKTLLACLLALVDLFTDLYAAVDENARHFGPGVALRSGRNALELATRGLRTKQPANEPTKENDEK